MCYGRWISRDFGKKIAFCFDIPVVPFTPIDAVYHPIHKEFGYLGKHQHYLANMICSLI